MQGYAINPAAIYFVEGAGQNAINANWGDGFSTAANVIQPGGASDPTRFFKTLLTKRYRCAHHSHCIKLGACRFPSPFLDQLLLWLAVNTIVLFLSLSLSHTRTLPVGGRAYALACGQGCSSVEERYPCNLLLLLNLSIGADGRQLYTSR